MSRIIAGSAKGRRVKTPPGDKTRPTSDRVREALFNSLAPGGDLTGMRFLDLYAGSGAIGLEALSRGAERAVLVESHVQTVKLIAQNVSDLGFTDRARVEKASVPAYVSGPASDKFDMVFVDPPYDVSDQTIADILYNLDEGGWLAPQADIVVERASKRSQVTWPGNFIGGRHRRYGNTSLWYGEYS
ncbi:16S rRNA (guanine(966)-N(2))-methyltransferase RsmD [Haloglycomyces albus]|uniref:16S rRNA (guanine(966)-N(2))-methyltransferase RsmD n=1 Tax=Haloglycomyces albus TaxID=526067 RepID=UPI00046C9AA4|nr:16S rRNA (guanine(966)-N(2))-methyltransferase RsmD [Haloglycomyces albus]